MAFRRERFTGARHAPYAVPPRDPTRDTPRDPTRDPPPDPAEVPARIKIKTGQYVQEDGHEVGEKSLMERVRELDSAYGSRVESEDELEREREQIYDEFGEWLGVQAMKRWKASRGVPNADRYLNKWKDPPARGPKVKWEDTRKVDMDFIEQLMDMRYHSEIIRACVMMLRGSILSGGVGLYRGGVQIQHNCQELDAWLQEVICPFVADNIEYLLCYGFTVYTVDSRNGTATVMTPDRYDMTIKRSAYGDERYCVRPKANWYKDFKFTDDHDDNFHYYIHERFDWKTGRCKGSLPPCLPLWVTLQTFLRNDKVIGVLNASPYAFFTSVNPGEMDGYVKMVDGLRPDVDGSLPYDAGSIQDRLDASDEIIRMLQRRDEDAIADTAKPASHVLPGITAGSLKIEDPSPTAFSHYKVPANMDVKFRPFAPYHPKLVEIMEQMDRKICMSMQVPYFIAETKTGNQSEVYEAEQEVLWKTSEQYRKPLNHLLMRVSRLLFDEHFVDYIRDNFDDPDEAEKIVAASGPPITLRLLPCASPREMMNYFDKFQTSWDAHRQYLVTAGKLDRNMFEEGADPRLKIAILGGAGRNGEDVSLGDQLTKASRGFTNSHRPSAPAWDK